MSEGRAGVSGAVRSFASEFRRRRVFQVAAVYAAVAFVLVQVANNFFPALHLEEWTITLVVALLVLGFPLAVSLAWVFDVTPEGIRRTPSSTAVSTDRPRATEDRSSPEVDGPSREFDGPSPEGDPPAPAPARAEGEVEREAKAPGSLRSVAVLPFANMSADPENEYFSDGLTEELLNLLARVEGLRVPARTSSFAFKDKHADIRGIGKKLRVEAVLEGSVRKVGNQIRITAQLINVEDGYHVWSESYDRELEDVFAIQAEIAEAIATAFRRRLTGDSAGTRVSSYTEDLETYDLYLRGRHARDQGNFVRAIAWFERALERSPRYALAHAGLAEAYAVLPLVTGMPEREAYPRAKTSAARALELDPSLPEAHAALGYALLRLDWDWEGAERHLTRAIELNPNYAVARSRNAEFLLARGRIEEAREESSRAQALDPLSPDIAANGALVHYCAGDHRSAIDHAERIIASDPGLFNAHWYLGLACLQDGQTERGVSALEKTVELTGGTDLFRSFLACGYALSGRRNEARAILSELEAARAERHIPSTAFPLLYAALGDRDAALDWLEKAVVERSIPAFTLPHEPLLDPLRSHPRFEALLETHGLG